MPIQSLRIGLKEVTHTRMGDMIKLFTEFPIFLRGELGFRKAKGRLILKVKVSLEKKACSIVAIIRRCEHTGL
jgi:hypothetical protein